MPGQIGEPAGTSRPKGGFGCAGSSLHSLTVTKLGLARVKLGLARVLC